MTALSDRRSRPSPEQRDKLDQELPDSTVTEALTADEARLWLAARMRGDVPSYNISFFVQLDIELDVAAFEAAFEEVVRRHAALRMQVRMIDERPFKRIKVKVPQALGHRDLSGLDRAETQTDLSALQVEIARHTFDLENGPLYRAVLVRLGAAAFRFIFCVHHLAFDARSKEVFLRDLSAFYEHFAKGAVRPRPVGPDSDPDRGDASQDEVSSYWRDKLADAPPLLQLPVPLTRAPVASYRGRYKSSAVDAEAWQRLRAHATARGATETVTLKAVCDVLLYRFGITDTVIGTPVSKRLAVEDEPIGYRVRACLLRTRFARDTTFDDVLAMVLNDFLDCLDHPALDFEAVLRATGHVKDEAFDPFWQVLFSHVTKEPEYRFGGSVVSAPFLEPGYTKADLELALIQTETALSFRTHCRADLFDVDVIETMHAEFRKLISALAIAPDRPISALFRELDTAAPVNMEERPPLSVVKHFLWCAERFPDRTAVITASRNVTYAELRALVMTFVDRIAGRAGSHGTRVGLCMRPSEYSVAAQLAVMAMGLCCEPFDFSLPRCQLRAAIGNVDSGLVIADADFAALFGTSEVELLLPTDQSGQIAEVRSLPAIPASAAAMVLGDSAPRGRTPVDHGALARMLEAGLLVMQSDAPNTALTAPAWTELGVLQTFVPLCMGACICVSNTPDALKAALRRNITLQWLGTAADMLRWSEDANWVQTVAALHPISPRPLGPSISSAFRQQGLRIGNRLVFGGHGIGPILSGDGTRANNQTPTMRPLAPLRILSGHGSSVVPGGYGEINTLVASAKAAVWRPTGWRARILPNGSVALAGRMTDMWHAHGGALDLADIEARLEEHPDVALAIAVAPDHARGAPSVLAGQLVARARLTPQ
jgi:Condensation domain/AMP-binding enzyme